MSRTILVVDDEPDLLQAVCGFLEDEGFTVKGAASGAEALVVLSLEPRPDLVLLDVMMPGLSGFEVLDRMETLGLGEIPVIVMSAVDLEQRPRSGRRRAFLKKPFGIDKLLGLIERSW